MNKKGNAAALLPMGVFFVIFMGVGILTQDFYKMPAIVGFLFALLTAFLQNKSTTFQEKMKIAAKGVGEETILTMCLIYLTAGAFSGAVKAAGGADSIVHFSLTILPSNISVVGLFLIGCFLSLSMGTSMGTISALAPIAAGISEKTGFSMAICISAVVCGAMFGDNLSIISDTTIAAVRTQGCEMKDKFKENFFLVLPAAILTLVIYIFLTRNRMFYLEEPLPYQASKMLPYGVVLIGALLGYNVFCVLISGTFLSLFIGVVTKAIMPGEIFNVLGNGITSMYDITIISIIVACIVALVKDYGGIDYLLSFIQRHVEGKKNGKNLSGKKSAQLGIAFLGGILDTATANNTIAIVIAGPIAKEISQTYQIKPKTAASLLDIFTSAVQGMLPYGAQLLSAAALCNITPFAILPYLFYPFIMCISGILWILLKEEKNER